ncbi:hypothetical protein FRC08_006731 [Ceratobasidium sp. 394]|nr:hypothetical protein FRC08_006731 [Ceratobasidium sp. 394]
MSHPTLGLSDTWSRLIQWSKPPLSAQGKSNEIILPGSTIAQAISSDIFLNISEFLHTPGDKLALATVSRWFYAALWYTPYVYLTLSQNVDVTALLTALALKNEYCTKIQHVDIICPSRFNPASLPKGEDQRTKRLLHTSRAVFTLERIVAVLKLATQLKSLHTCGLSLDTARLESLTACMRESYSFNLKSLAIARPITGALSLIKSQPQLVELSIFSDDKGLNSPPERDAPPPPPPAVSLSHLRTLWATPWWSSAILPGSPVRQFALLHGNVSEEERRTCRDLVNSLARTGGHPTVECLVLTYEDFFWDHQTVDLRQYEPAFPGVTKLCITLPGFRHERTENTETTLNFLKRVVDKYPSYTWPSIRQVVFLRPGDDWPNPYDEPYRVERMGKRCEIELVFVLEGLLPGLEHVDFVKNCYRKSSENGYWQAHPRICHH